MKITLAASDTEMADAWDRYCGDVEGVSVHRGSILDLSADAAVSPTDVFGFMSGGVSFAYVGRYGWKVQERLQSLIRARHHGQLLVGVAEIVATDDPHIPFLIAAPIVRTPTLLQGSVNAYLAARAVLLLATEGRFMDGSPVASVVSSIAFPGLGTGGARLGHSACARQVRAAIDEVLLGRSPFPQSTDDVIKREGALAAD